MKRLIILCVGLLAFSVSAAPKVIEQQGMWSIIDQVYSLEPTYILSVENENIYVALVCATAKKRILLSIRYYNVMELKKTLSLYTDLSVYLEDGKENKFLGTVVNYRPDTILWANFVDYAGYLKGHNQEKEQLIPIFSQLFKQLPSVTGNITFTVNGEENTLYQVSVSTEGLPVMFTHFVKYCGTDFMAAFDISIENQ